MGGNGDNGDGDRPGINFSRFVEKPEFDAFCVKVNNAMWGSDGRDGIVMDINELKINFKMGLKILAFLVAVVSPILTALLLKYFVGV